MGSEISMAFCHRHRLAVLAVVVMCAVASETAGAAGQCKREYLAGFQAGSKSVQTVEANTEHTDAIITSRAAKKTQEAEEAKKAAEVGKKKAEEIKQKEEKAKAAADLKTKKL